MRAQLRSKVLSERWSTKVGFQNCLENMYFEQRSPAEAKSDDKDHCINPDCSEKAGIDDPNVKFSNGKTCSGMYALLCKNACTVSKEYQHEQSSAAGPYRML